VLYSGDGLVAASSDEEGLITLVRFLGTVIGNRVLGAMVLGMDVCGDRLYVMTRQKLHRFGLPALEKLGDPSVDPRGSASRLALCAGGLFAVLACTESGRFCAWKFRLGGSGKPQALNATCVQQWTLTPAGDVLHANTVNGKLTSNTEGQQKHVFTSSLSLCSC